MYELGLRLGCLTCCIVAVFTVVVGVMNGISLFSIVFRAVVSVIVFAVLGCICFFFYLKNGDEVRVLEENERGVDTDYVLHGLQEAELVRNSSKEESPTMF